MALTYGSQFFEETYSSESVSYRYILLSQYCYNWEVQPIWCPLYDRTRWNYRRRGILLAELEWTNGYNNRLGSNLRLSEDWLWMHINTVPCWTFDKCCMPATIAEVVSLELPGRHFYDGWSVRHIWLSLSRAIKYAFMNLDTRNDDNNLRSSTVRTQDTL